MEPDELTEVAQVLRRLLDAIERGEITAPPAIVHRFEGALIVAEATSGPPSDLLDRLSDITNERLL